MSHMGWYLLSESWVGEGWKSQFSSFALLKHVAARVSKNDYWKLAADLVFDKEAPNRAQYNAN